MMALAAPPVLDKKRVKVYELKRNDWHDRGTGFCTGTVVNDEPHLHVESEDDPTRTLLETRICKDDGYQKQQDTLIVWTEASVTDMALSFQEAEGCAAIWEFVNDAQQRFGGTGDDGFSDEGIDTMLPNPDLGNLSEIENTMRMANSSMASRDALAKYIVASDYIGKLVPLVGTAEGLESLSDLHKLCNIMKTIILLNDQNVMDKVVSDEWWMGVIGALEYDPDFPNHKANHRQYLSDGSRFREVVKIEDVEIRSRFHKTYRLQYLKDVILARIIDDPTFGTINGSIYYHQFAIIEHIQQSPAILKELFGIFADPKASFQRKKDAVCFIQQSCAALKTIQAAQQRAHMFNAFIAHGLFHVIAFALAHPNPSVRVSGSDILMAVLEHDVNLIKTQIMRALTDEKAKPLLDTLIDLLLVETDLGVQTQIVDALRFLLDPIQQQPPVPMDAAAGQRTNFEFMAKLRSNPAFSQSETILQKYYEECARKVFQPLRDLEKRENVDSLSVHEVSLFSQLLELLTHLTRQYAQRAKPWLLADPLAPRVAQLLRCPEKHLKLSALKYFRSCIGLHEPFHIRQIIQHRLCEPILNVLFETMPRDNLLNSACLEFFEFIKRDPQENLKELTIHLGEAYKGMLEKITYVDTFKNLLDKYDEIVHPPTQPENASFTSVETEQTPQRTGSIGGPGHHPNGVRHRCYLAFKEMDAEELAYFPGTDGENEAEEEAAFTSSGNKLGSLSNGASPIKPLVDYPDDDDEELDILAAADMSPARPVTIPETTALVPQPERMTEKRRRDEEDDEDELSAASTPPLTKKRSFSLGSSSSIKPEPAPATGRVLRRKGSINSGKDGGLRKTSPSPAVKSEEIGGNGTDVTT